MSGTQLLIDATRPRSALAHLVDHADGAQLFLTNGSRLFDLDPDAARQFRHGLEAGDEALQALLVEHGLDLAPSISPDPPRGLAVRALSLAIAQTCNLGCGYCYAQGGAFGGAATRMDLATAKRSVDLLLNETRRGERANLAFLGGEPLAARAAMRQATDYAAEQAAANGVRLSFSITTNGTLLTPDDGVFFEHHGFAITVSLDGVGAAHDALRPFKGGAGSYARILERVEPLLAMQRRMQISARVTVTPANFDLVETMETFVGLGFHNVGFSPMLSAPQAGEGLHGCDPEALLSAMIACAGIFETHAMAGRRYPFANVVNALREIHKGTHRPYPCGAGAGYLGVSADGDLSACHRFVGDEAGAMGSLSSGVDRSRQDLWLDQRHVDRQSPCSGCWARYLCGGGCHHETMTVGRPACDFIRGWLHHCLGLYGRLSRNAPEVLAQLV